MSLLNAIVYLPDQVAGSCDQLICGPQTQFLLVFDALPEMQYGLQGELEGHGIIPAKP